VKLMNTPLSCGPYCCRCCCRLCCCCCCRLSDATTHNHLPLVNERKTLCLSLQTLIKQGLIRLVLP
jgi:hypothetical protein